MQQVPLPRKLTAAILLGLLSLGACGGDAEDTATPRRARPVTLIVIHESSPSLGVRITGVAEAVREEAIGFEVQGRVEFVERVGKELAGPILDKDEDGYLIERQAGEMVARLDRTRYQQALDVARLRLASARKGLEAERLEVGSVAQSELDRAKANAAGAEQDIKAKEARRGLVRVTLERTRGLFQEGSASKAQLDRDQAEYDNAAADFGSAVQMFAAAKAGVATAEANIKFKEAQIEQTLAEIEELEQARRQAVTDLEDCTLEAPFSGRITAYHTGRGGYVLSGQQVVTLTMVDPIQVVVTVTADKSREILPGSAVALYPRDLARFTGQSELYGSVRGKAEVADAATRTLRIEILVRNVRRQPYAEAAGGRKVHTIDRVLPVLTETVGAGGALFVPLDSIVREGDQNFVYRLPGVFLGRPSEVDIAGVFNPQKLPITRGERILTFINMSFVNIQQGSGLTVGEMLIADPKPEHTEGVALAGTDWAIRPGDLVPVSFELGSAAPGFYVPAEAVANLNERRSVFVVQDGRCREIVVTAHESSGTLRRIEGEGLVSGMQIVIEGHHYLRDGDEVDVVEVLELDQR